MLRRQTQRCGVGVLVCLVTFETTPARRVLLGFTPCKEIESSRSPYSSNGWWQVVAL